MLLSGQHSYAAEHLQRCCRFSLGNRPCPRANPSVISARPYLASVPTITSLCRIYKEEYKQGEASYGVWPSSGKIALNQPHLAFNLVIQTCSGNLDYQLFDPNGNELVLDELEGLVANEAVDNDLANAVPIYGKAFTDNAEPGTYSLIIRPDRRLEQASNTDEAGMGDSAITINYDAQLYTGPRLELIDLATDSEIPWTNPDFEINREVGIQVNLSGFRANEELALRLYNLEKLLGGWVVQADHNGRLSEPLRFASEFPAGSFTLVIECELTACRLLDDITLNRLPLKISSSVVYQHFRIANTSGPISRELTSDEAINEESTLTKTTDSVSGEEFVYMVAAGDSLSHLARRYSVTIAALANANRLSPRDYLLIGQQLTIPATVAGLPCAWVQTVTDDNSLASIAQSRNVDAARLAQANGFNDSDEIRIGQRICFPNIYSSIKPNQ